MRCFILIVSSLLFCYQVSAQPVVATSIKPLQLIASAITADVSEPVLILEGNEDPHHPSLRPSQRRDMAEADVFFWVGPSLETGLERVVSGMKAEVITALEIPELKIWDNNGLPDPHVWLDTDNALLMASALAKVMADKDPVNAGTYQKNLDRFTQGVKATVAGISERLVSQIAPAFVVYHNGYQYFEQQFGLVHQGSFTTNEEIAPGIRQILAIRTTMEKAGIRCVVVDPSVNTRNLDNQLGQANARFVIIDVLGRDVPVGQQGYSQLIDAVAQGFSSCHD